MAVAGAGEELGKAMQHGTRHYSGAQIALHWIIAALVVAQLFTGEWMEEAWRGRATAIAPENGGTALPAEAVATSGATVHIAIGVTILLLAAFRVFMRFSRGAPPLPESHPKWLKFIAGANHFVLYLFLFFMPLTGAMAWFGGIDAAANAHELGKTLLIVFVALHVTGALVELLVLRTHSVHRILGIEPDRRADLR